MRIRFLLILILAASSAACDDDLGLEPWNATPDTVSLFSLSRPDLIGLPSGYDFVGRRQIELEAPGSAGSWDVALGGTASQLVLIPAASFQGQGTSRAAIATITSQSFSALLEAPDDTSRYSTEPVPITTGGVYVIRTRRAACGFSTAVRFGKIHAVNVDPALGKATFAVVVNPYCNDRSFVPPED